MICIQCGAEMVSTTGGNYYCTKCGAAINDLVYRPHNYSMSIPQGFQQQGWICPICGRGMSPWVDFCPCVNKEVQVTYGDTNSTNGTDTTYSLKNDGNSQATITQTDSEWMKFGTLTNKTVGSDSE